MVALYRLRDRKSEILANAAAIAKAVLALAQPTATSYELLVGRGNTAASIKERIALVQATIISNL